MPTTPFRGSARVAFHSDTIGEHSVYFDAQRVGSITRTIVVMPDSTAVVHYFVNIAGHERPAFRLATLGMAKVRAHCFLLSNCP